MMKKLYEAGVRRFRMFVLDAALEAIFERWITRAVVAVLGLILDPDFVKVFLWQSWFL